MVRVAAVAVAVVAVVALVVGFTLRPGETARTTPTITTPRTDITPRVETTPTMGGVVVSNPPDSAINTSLTFEPSYVRVVIGVNNTVTWVNDDTTIHTVTSTIRLFDYQLQPRQRISYTFTSPGVFQYICTLHPWMTGVVEVASP